MLRQTPETSTIVQFIFYIKIKSKKISNDQELIQSDPISTCLEYESNKNEYTQVPRLDRSAPFMNGIAVSKDGVIKLLKSLNPSKALGPDELHPSPKGSNNRVRSGICSSFTAIN